MNLFPISVLILRSLRFCIQIQIIIHEVVSVVPLLTACKGMLYYHFVLRDTSESITYYILLNKNFRKSITKIKSVEDDCVNVILIGNFVYNIGDVMFLKLIFLFC